MDRLAGSAKRTGRSVRSVSRWSHNTGCGLNNAMFAARVDADRLLDGTSVAQEFGQSPFAIARGARVEAIGRARHLCRYHRRSCVNTPGSTTTRHAHWTCATAFLATTPD